MNGSSGVPAHLNITEKVHENSYVRNSWPFLFTNTIYLPFSGGRFSELEMLSVSNKDCVPPLIRDDHGKIS